MCNELISDGTANQIQCVRKVVVQIDYVRVQLKCDGTR